MSFEKLLAELDEMNKAMGADDGAADTKISEAAADGEAAGDDDPDGDGDAEADVDGDGDGDGEEGEGDEFGKSFRFTTEGGEEVEALDATDLIKSLIERMDQNDDMLGKALASMVDLVKSQGSEISALRSEVERLGQTGRGRKTVVTMAERPEPATMAKSDPVDGEDGIPTSEFMSKALTAQASGKILGVEVARAESYINRGLPVPADIVRKVMG